MHLSREGTHNLSPGLERAPRGLIFSVMVRRSEKDDLSRLSLHTTTSLGQFLSLSPPYLFQLMSHRVINVSVENTVFTDEILIL